MSSLAFGQDSLIVQPVPSLPQGQYGTPGDDDEKEDRVEVRRENLPGKMTDALERFDKFDGWEESPVYFETNSDQFIVTVVRDNSTQTFRFDKEGNEIAGEAVPIRRGQRH